MPTIGNKTKDRKKFYSLANKKHLECIDKLITGGGGKLFLVPGGVLKDTMKLKKDLEVFPWLEYPVEYKVKYSKHIKDNCMREIYHFSSSQIHKQLPEIKQIIRNWLKKQNQT